MIRVVRPRQRLRRLLSPGLTSWRHRRACRNPAGGSASGSSASSRPGAWLTRKNKVFGGGSSSILRSALTPDVSSSSMLSITATRHGDIAGVMPEELAQLAHLIDGDVAGEVAGLLVLEPLQPAHVGMAACLDQLDDRMVVAASRCRADRSGDRQRRRARGVPPHGRSSLCPRPWGPRAATRDAACAAPRRSRTARPRVSWPTITAAGPRLRRAGAASPPRACPTHR